MTPSTHTHTHTALLHGARDTEGCLLGGQDEEANNGNELGGGEAEELMVTLKAALTDNNFDAIRQLLLEQEGA
eukprot:2560033-Rhodomonas_salina.1